MEKRTYTLAVRVKSSKPVPDWGLGPGVLARREYTFTDRRGQGFDNMTFECCLAQYRDEMIHEHVECVTESIKNEKQD